MSARGSIKSPGDRQRRHRERALHNINVIATDPSWLPLWGEAQGDITPNFQACDQMPH
jgi:hypothetical protein